MKRRTMRLLCVDDHAFVIEGLEARLDLEGDLEVVGRLARADDLVDHVRRLRADIVLLDIEMPGADPFDAVAELVRRCPEVRVVMLSAYVRDHYIDAAYRAGAWGYLSKSDPPEAVVRGIRRVADGELAWSDEVLDRMRRPDGTRPGHDPGAADGHGRNGDDDALSRLGALTDRECQILRLIARGMTRTDIARQLSRSPMTVDNHRKSIMRKLDINDRAELVRYALAEGMAEI